MCAAVCALRSHPWKDVVARWCRDLLRFQERPIGRRRSKCLPIWTWPAPIRSGGASNVLQLLIDGTLPEGVNHLRLGTAPLLGLYTSHGPRPVAGWDRDTVVAEAEVIEVKRHRPEALLALGHLDAPMDYLYPTTPGIELLRQSSDHTVIRFPQAAAARGPRSLPSRLPGDEPPHHVTLHPRRVPLTARRPASGPDPPQWIQQRLYFLPLPHGQRSLRPTLPPKPKPDAILDCSSPSWSCPPAAHSGQKASESVVVVDHLSLGPVSTAWYWR